MSRLIIEHLALCDAQGNTIGHYLPDAEYRKLVRSWANAQVTDEALDAAARQPGGRTLKEILARLA